MSIHRLSHRPERDQPRLDLAPGLGLRLARVHEACGPARRSFALWLAARTHGPVLWIAPAWEPVHPHPDGMRPFADPARFLFVTPRKTPDLLWCAEEALRAGAVPLVVADLPGLPGLTPVRRLHLAAETGAGQGTPPPLGLLLTPGEGGAQGGETRWHMAPIHQGTVARWRLERRRARTLPPRSWLIERGRDGLAPVAEAEPSLPA